MQRILLIKIVIAMSSVVAFGQDVYCWNYTQHVKHFLNRKVKESKDTMFFDVSRNIIGQLRLTDAGMPYTVKMDLKFTDTLGYTLPTSEILKITFKDNTQYEIMQSSKKIYKGDVFFILVQSQKKHSPVLTEEDQLFYEKLTKTDMVSLSIVIGNYRREIPIDEDQAEFIKRVVHCFAQP